MARLNEAPAPALETIEAIKRKYTRQNREIVRTNTAQSARIRNLEYEITRLLNENLAWREEAISARAEAEKWKAAHRLTQEVVRMKEQLEQKLSEVNDLVGELGALPEKVARRSSQRRRRDGFVSELTKANVEREPRHRQTILEQEGRLPAIVEDKYYPRQTLEANEISILRSGPADDATESPDIGPPPVAHFDEADAVVFDATKSPRRTSTELIEETERASRPSVASIENRRRRRTSTLLQTSAFDTHELEVEDTEITAVEPTPKHEPEKGEPPVQPQSILKKGAKRKLEVTELEDTSRVSKELDDFIFQRRAAAPAATTRPSRFSRPPGRQTQDNVGQEPERSPERASQPARKILAPKSTNSPAKRRIHSDGEKQAGANDENPLVKPEKKTVPRVRARPTIGGISPADISLNEPAESDAGGQIHAPPPKTPAPELDDVLSPISTEPSQKQRQSKEAAITNSVEDVLNGSIGRGSRRARAAVSYAEPNLRDKMRRPGKELVSAVEGLSRQPIETDRQRSRSASDDASQADARHNHQDVKSETVQAHSVRWQDSNPTCAGKSEPVSPLRSRTASHSRKSDALEGSISSIEAQRSVFDPPQSSPTASDPDPNIDGKPKPGQQVLKSRRHSTQPTANRDVSLSANSNSSSVLRTRRANSISAARREDKTTVTSQDEARGHVRKSASVTTLPTTQGLGSNAGSKGHIAVDHGYPDAESTAARGGLSRRRSLMV